MTHNTLKLVYQRSFAKIDRGCIQTTGIDTCIITVLHSPVPALAHLDSNEPYLAQFKKVVEKLRSNFNKVTIFFTLFSNKEYLEELSDWIRENITEDIEEKEISVGKCIEVCNNSRYRVFNHEELLRAYPPSFWYVLKDYVLYLINKRYLVYLNTGELIRT